MAAKVVHSPGKRKRCIARATITEGKGDYRINSLLLDVHPSAIAKEKIRLPIILASGHVDPKTIDIRVTVEGGGVMGQSDAIASALARALVEWTGSEELLSKYLHYDRTLIAGDHRLTEPHKPSHSSQGPRARRQKSYR